MNRSKSTKTNRSSSSNSANKSAKTTGQNGTPTASPAAAFGSTKTSSPADNDVTGWSKKSNKAKKSSKAAAKQTNNASSSVSASKSSSSAKSTPTLSHPTTSPSSPMHSSNNGNGMNQSMVNTNKNKFPVLEPKKLERSHSFISRGFSKLYSSITGSRDGINKIPEDKEVSSTANGSASPEPPKFRRSLTLGSFSIKRRSIRESALGKLSEENELRHKDDSNTTSPRDSQSIAQTPSMTDVAARVDNAFDERDWRNAEEDENNNTNGSSSRQRRMSFGQTSLADIDKDASRYGSGLMTRLKRTFSITSEKRKQMNPVWSASLQNLQSIDNMVSYNDLSFIDYDKFNEIDKRYEDLTTSQMHLNRMSTGSQPSPVHKNVYQREMSVPAQSSPKDCVDHHHHLPSVQQQHPHLKYSPSTKSETSAMKVKRREHKFNTEYTKNLDEGKNLYRQSLDSQKLQFLNERNRESFRFSSSFDPKTVDYLLLDKCNNGAVQREGSGDGTSGSTSWESKEVVAEEDRRIRRRHSEPILNGSEQCSRLVSQFAFMSSLSVLVILKVLCSEARFVFLFVFVIILGSVKCTYKTITLNIDLTMCGQLPKYTYCESQ